MKRQEEGHYYFTSEEEKRNRRKRKKQDPRKDKGILVQSILSHVEGRIGKENRYDTKVNFTLIQQ